MRPSKIEYGAFAAYFVTDFGGPPSLDDSPHDDTSVQIQKIFSIVRPLSSFSPSVSFNIVLMDTR